MLGCCDGLLNLHQLGMRHCQVNIRLANSRADMARRSVLLVNTCASVFGASAGSGCEVKDLPSKSGHDAYQSHPKSGSYSVAGRLC